MYLLLALETEQIFALGEFEIIFEKAKKRKSDSIWGAETNLWILLSPLSLPNTQ